PCSRSCSRAMMRAFSSIRDPLATVLPSRWSFVAAAAAGNGLALSRRDRVEGRRPDVVAGVRALPAGRLDRPDVGAAQPAALGHLGHLVDLDLGLGEACLEEQVPVLVD